MQDQTSAPRTHTGQLTTFSNLGFKESDVHFWPPKTLHSLPKHSHRHRCMHINRNRINLFFKVSIVSWVRESGLLRREGKKYGMILYQNPTRWQNQPRDEQLVEFKADALLSHSEKHLQVDWTIWCWIAKTRHRWGTIAFFSLDHPNMLPRCNPPQLGALRRWIILHGHHWGQQTCQEEYSIVRDCRVDGVRWHSRGHGTGRISHMAFVMADLVVNLTHLGVGTSV